MKLYRHGKWHSLKFYAIDTENYQSPAMHGLKNCEDLQIVTVRNTDSIAESQPIENIEDLETEFPKQFDTIGNFDSEVTLHLKHNAEPFIAAPRKYSIHMKPALRPNSKTWKIKESSGKSTNSDWCSSVCFVTKKTTALECALE